MLTFQLQFVHIYLKLMTTSLLYWHSKTQNVMIPAESDQNNIISRSLPCLLSFHLIPPSHFLPWLPTLYSLVYFFLPQFLSFQTCLVLSVLHPFLLSVLPRQSNGTVSMDQWLGGEKQYRERQRRTRFFRKFSLNPNYGPRTGWRR